MENPHLEGFHEPENTQNRDNLKQVLAESEFRKTDIEREGPPSLEDYQRAEQALDQLILMAKAEGETPKFTRICQELFTVLNIVPDALSAFVIVCIRRLADEGEISSNWTFNAFTRDLESANDLVIARHKEIIQKVLSFGATFPATDTLNKIQEQAELLLKAQYPKETHTEPSHTADSN